MTVGPTKTSELSVISSVTDGMKVVALATVNGSLQTVITPVSVITGYTPPALDSITDVSIGTLIDGGALTYSSTRGQYILTTIGACAFSSLADATISSPVAGHILVYGSDAKWHNQAPDYLSSASLATLNLITSASASTLASVVAASQNLQSHANVTISAITNGDILVYRTADSKWHNEANTGGAGITAIASASDVSISALVDGQYLVYNSASGDWLNSTIDFMTSGSTSAMIATQLGTYITSNSVSVLLGSYITSNSASVLVANFITSASASVLTRTIIAATNIQALNNVSVSSAVEGQLLVWNSVAQEFQNTTVDIPTSASVSTMITAALTNYITSASVSTMVSTMVVNFITSASASALTKTLLGPYLTSASAETRFPRAFASLTDVTVSAATDGQYLTFVSADGKWHNTTIPDWITSTSVSAMVSTMISAANAGTAVSYVWTTVTAWTQASSIRQNFQSIFVSGKDYKFLISNLSIAVSATLAGNLFMQFMSAGAFNTDTSYDVNYTSVIIGTIPETTLSATVGGFRLLPTGLFGDSASAKPTTRIELDVLGSIVEGDGMLTGTLIINSFVSSNCTWITVNGKKKSGTRCDGASFYFMPGSGTTVSTTYSGTFMLMSRPRSI